MYFAVITTIVAICCGMAVLAFIGGFILERRIEKLEKRIK
jgi:hypothetical protein